LLKSKLGVTLYLLFTWGKEHTMDTLQRLQQKVMETEIFESAT